MFVSFDHESWKLYSLNIKTINNRLRAPKQAVTRSNNRDKHLERIKLTPMRK